MLIAKIVLIHLHTIVIKHTPIIILVNKSVVNDTLAKVPKKKGVLLLALGLRYQRRVFFFAVVYDIRQESS